MNGISHPDDVALRNGLIDDFIRRRVEKLVGIRSLAAALGVEKNAVQTFERRRPSNPHLGTLVKYGAALELNVRVAIDGIDVVRPPVADSLAACGFPGAALASTLRATRIQAGVSRRELAANVSGWSYGSVCDLELSEAEWRLSTLQAYTRGLGGRLTARWEAL